MIYMAQTLPRDASEHSDSHKSLEEKYGVAKYPAVAPSHSRDAPSCAVRSTAVRSRRRNSPIQETHWGISRGMVGILG